MYFYQSNHNPGLIHDNLHYFANFRTTKNIANIIFPSITIANTKQLNTIVMQLTPKVIQGIECMNDFDLHYKVFYTMEHFFCCFSPCV